MGDRIERLNAEIKEARAQQSDTRASIGKIMEFLSQVYHDQRRGAPMPRPQGEQGGRQSGRGRAEAVRGSSARCALSSEKMTLSPMRGPRMSIAATVLPSAFSFM